MPPTGAGTDWKGPVMLGGAGRIVETALPPSISVALQTSFFMASLGFTQGPPVSLQPGDEAMVSSSPSLSANSAVCLKAAFHSGVI